MSDVTQSWRLHQVESIAIRSESRRPPRVKPDSLVFGIMVWRKEKAMDDSIYNVIELVGTSTESWEKAARAAVERASQSLKDLRVVELLQLDMQLSEGKVETYRCRVRLSFADRETWREQRAIRSRLYSDVADAAGLF